MLTPLGIHPMGIMLATLLKHGFLPYPWRPGLTWSCPKCGRNFALQQIAKRDDPVAVKVVTYRCKYCSEDVESALGRPPHCV